MKNTTIMKKELNTTFLAGFIAILLLPTHAVASSIGIGIGRESEYPGSDDFEFLPNAAFELETSIGTLKNNRVGAQLDILSNDSVDTGPILRVNFGRDDSISDEVVAALDEVDPALELGWFVNSGFKLERLGVESDAIVIGNLNAVTDVGDGHGGSQITGSIGLVLQLTDDFRLVPSIGFNYADDNYTDAFYSVSSAGAADSGLAEFSASGGLEYTQVALYAVRTIDERWSVTGTVALNTLQADAAESPITRRGTDKQLFTAVVANYAF